MPTKPDEDRRDDHLHLRVTAEEHETFARAAQAEGLTLAAWVRRTLLHAARKQRRG